MAKKKKGGMDVEFATPAPGSKSAEAARSKATGAKGGKSAEKKPEERELIKGVFSTQEMTSVGTGTTDRKTIQKMFWMAEEQKDAEGVMVQPLNTNYVPSGPKKTVAKEDFLQKFSPEPELYVQTVLPRMKNVKETISRADRHRKKGELFSAEFEYGSALKVDEENVRANFGLGLTYLDRGEKGKADNIFERLVKLDAAFEEEHKHLFNDFGIKLRKNKMFDQSVEYYERAMKLSHTDENIHYNIARAYFEKNQVQRAKEHLLKALHINPDLAEAHQFLDWMKERGLIKKDVQPPKPGAKGAKATAEPAAAAAGSPPRQEAPHAGPTEDIPEEVDVPSGLEDEDMDLDLNIDEELD